MANPATSPTPYAADASMSAAVAARTSGTSWAAIIAGAFAAAAMSLVFFVLGSGISLAIVSPWNDDGPSAASLGIGAATWLVATQIVASGLGGYIAGRLRARWIGIQSQETFFRDTAHGFLAWAVATIFAAALMTATISSIAGAGARATTSVLSGVALGAAQSAVPTMEGAGPAGYIVDKLYRSDRPLGETGQVDVRAETLRMVRAVAADDALSPADRRYLTQLVSARTGIPSTEAEARVDTMVADVKAAAATAKEALDSARETGALLSLVTVIGLLSGALAASGMAVWGGRRRDLCETGNSFVAALSQAD